MLIMTQSVDEIPLDAIAFCDLLARILYRCLKDQEARLILFPIATEGSFAILQQENNQVKRKINSA